MASEINPVDILRMAFGGTDSSVAKALGVSRACICRWRKQSTIPVKRIKEISKKTNVPKALLNPIFRPDEEQKSQRD